jgi:hypothetical protein
MDPDPYINNQKCKKIYYLDYLLFCEFDFLSFETDDDVPLLLSKVNILNVVPKWKIEVKLHGADIGMIGDIYIIVLKSDLWWNVKVLYCTVTMPT